MAFYNHQLLYQTMSSSSIQAADVVRSAVVAVVLSSFSGEGHFIVPIGLDQYRQLQTKRHKGTKKTR